MASLLIRHPDGSTSRVDLAERPLTLGRSDACDVVLPSEEISRIHAEITRDEQGRVVVADRGSKNGTRVDAGDAFRSTARVAAHSIRIGEYAIEILSEPGAARDDDEEVRFQPDETPTGQTRFFPSSRQLDLSQQRLGLLMSLAERIGGAFERKQLLEQAIDACCETLGFERGLIVLRTRPRRNRAPRHPQRRSATRPAPTRSAARSSTAPSSTANARW
jgi:DNA-binding response OmpR family regulator